MFPFPRLQTVLLGLLLSSMMVSAQGAEPGPAARAQAVLKNGLETITAISADAQGGVWALTNGGKLYHCRRTGQGKEARVDCVARQGPVAGDY